MDDSDFIDRFVQNSRQLMWFLGAGSSREAGMPMAIDIIWDLKCRYYCNRENQDIQRHDLGKTSVRHNIQSYMDSRRFPALNSDEEYSFYFSLVFGEDDVKQQAYISEVLSLEKISLNDGHRTLAALIKIGLARVILTTNFDEVIETAYTEISGKPIFPFHLEGDYAALDALNAEKFPIYVKIHGDLRYRNIKNPPQNPKDNNSRIKKFFLNAATRYGLVVTGYSGRDKNVMSMLNSAIEQDNAFPHGLFWTVQKKSIPHQSVINLLKKAKELGIDSHLVKIENFNRTLSRIWNQIKNKPEEIDRKVKKSRIYPVSIPMGEPGKHFPVLRTNALPILAVPTNCGYVSLSGIKTYAELKKRVSKVRPDAVTAYMDNVLFWGSVDGVKKLCIQPHEAKFEQKSLAIKDCKDSTILRAFLINALSSSLVEGKPHLQLRKREGIYYIVVNHLHRGNEALAELRNVLACKGELNSVAGQVNDLRDTDWAEAVSLRLNFCDERLWLLLRPDIWISPMKNRERAIKFLRDRRISRYNDKTYKLLDAWIAILFGQSVGKEEVSTTYRPKSDFPAKFTIALRTAYSKGGY